MRSYFMRGVCEKEGEEYRQVGIINLDKKGKVTGSLMERNSKHVLRGIKGYHGTIGGSVEISFSVFSDSGREIMRYHMRKTEERTKTEGRYKGFCFFNGRSGTARMTLDSKV